MTHLDLETSPTAGKAMKVEGLRSRKLRVAMDQEQQRQAPERAEPPPMDLLSTSSHSPAVAEQQLSMDDADLNETLEAFAKNYHLSAQNVKNIIYHVVKNPQTLSTLIGKDKEAVDTLRLTRARKRELEKITQAKLGIELKPIPPPKTFLDVDYGEEDEDVDYWPEEEVSAVEDDERTPPEEEEGDNEDEFPNESNPQWGELMREAAFEGNVVRAYNHSSMTAENAGSPSNKNFLVTQVDDPDYLHFVNSCLSSDPLLASINEDDDDEYNALQDIEMNAVEEEEYRMDRTTRVPRWEIEALYDDVLTPDGEPVLRKKKCPPTSHLRHRDSRQLISANSVRPETPSEPQPGPPISTGEGDTVVPLRAAVLQASVGCMESPGHCDLSATSSSLVGDDEEEGEDADSRRSCSLLAADGITLSDDEHQLLRVQLEKHVQLLTQCVVGSFGEPELAATYNSAVKMIHDLNDEQERYERDGGNLIIFNPNQLTILQDAIVSCHDISACQSVELPCLSVNSNFASPGYFTYAPPRSEVVWVLSRSKALRYPELLPNFRFARHEPPSSKFLPSEQILLAMALHSLRRVRHSNWKQSQVAQIKNHLKNVRCSQKRSPLHTILLHAERGVFNATFQLGLETARSEIPLEWEDRCQPQWLQQISKLYKQGLIRVVNAVSASQDNSCSAGTAMSNNDGVARISGTGILGQQHSRHSSLAEEEESTYNDQCHNANRTEMMSCDVGGVEGKRQKSRKRLRMERGAQALVDARTRERALRALVEAINTDLKQRFFMHQDKLREIQALIADGRLSTAEMLCQLADKYGEEYFSIVALLSALLPPTPDIALSTDPTTNAYRRALEMFLDVQCYLSGACRNATGIRNAFKSIKEDMEKEGPASERWLAEKLKQQFGTRDEPLWRLLKARLDSEKWDEKPEDWEYEFIDMDKDDHHHQASGVVFETLTLPYRYDSSERGRLRLRHGRVTLEQNGRLKAVNIGLVADTSEGTTLRRSNHAAPIWNREDDKLLLMSLNHYNGDRRQVVANFKVPGKDRIDREVVDERLTYLLDLVQLAHQSAGSF